GPVGLALALGLARQGVRSIVLEQLEKPSEYSRAPGILTRTLEIFDAWKVFDRFMAEGTFVRDLRPFWVDTERPIFTLPLRRLHTQTRYPGVMFLPQNRTEALLAQAVVETGYCEIRRGHRVLTFQDGSIGVRVRVQPNEGQAYTLRGAFLVGCDGARSVVRQKLGFTFDGITYPRRFLLADFHLTDARDRQGWPRVAMDDGCISAAIRIAP